MNGHLIFAYSLGFFTVLTDIWKLFGLHICFIFKVVCIVTLLPMKVFFFKWIKIKLSLPTSKDRICLEIPVINKKYLWHKREFCKWFSLWSLHWNETVSLTIRNWRKGGAPYLNFSDIKKLWPYFYVIYIFTNCLQVFAIFTIYELHLYFSEK